MDKTALQQALTGKDNQTAYNALKEAEALSVASSEFYFLFDFYLELLKSENNFFSVRGQE